MKQSQKNFKQKSTCCLWRLYSATITLSKGPRCQFNDFEAEIIKAGEKQMTKIIGEYFSGYPDIKPKGVLGNAAEKILRHIECVGIDMVFMGTHGRKGLDRIFFGSVADTVIKKAPAPVMGINPYRISSKIKTSTLKDSAHQVG